MPPSKSPPPAPSTTAVDPPPRYDRITRRRLDTHRGMTEIHPRCRSFWLDFSGQSFLYAKQVFPRNLSKPSLPPQSPKPLMTTRHHFVASGVSCTLVLLASARAADRPWDGSDSPAPTAPLSAPGSREGDPGEKLDPAPVLRDGGISQSPRAPWGSITAVPEASVAALIGSIGLLALVRRRRG